MASRKPKVEEIISPEVSEGEEEEEITPIRATSSRRTATPTPSSSRREESSRESISTTREWRKTARPDMKTFIPDPDDLWAIAGKYLVDRELTEILLNASTVASNPIPSAYAKKKNSAGKTLSKAAKLARVLALRKPRILALELLKEKGVVDQEAKLKDFFLQFFDDGEVFPGDAPDSREIKEASGIPILEGKKTPSRGSRVTSGPEISTEFFPQSLLLSLQKAVAEDPERPFVMSEERAKILKRFLDVVSQLDDTAIQDETEDMEKRME
jgi:hypothetical protein